MTAEIIQIGDLAVARKYRSYGFDGECQHMHIQLEHGDIVNCLDCKKQLSAFWALEFLVQQYLVAVDRLRSEREIVAKAKQESLHLIAARKVEQAWRSRSMVPVCPHCHTAIFPEDGFGGSQINREIALRRRKVKS